MNERRADLPQDSRICLGDVTGAVSQNGCVEFEANALWNAMENGLSDDLIIDSETWRRSEDDGDHETQGDVEHVEDHRQ